MVAYAAGNESAVIGAAIADAFAESGRVVTLWSVCQPGSGVSVYWDSRVRTLRSCLPQKHFVVLVAVHPNSAGPPGPSWCYYADAYNMTSDTTPLLARYGSVVASSRACINKLSPPNNVIGHCHPVLNVSPPPVEACRVGNPVVSIMVDRSAMNDAKGLWAIRLHKIAGKRRTYPLEELRVIRWTEWAVEDRQAIRKLVAADYPLNDIRVTSMDAAVAAVADSDAMVIPVSAGNLGVPVALSFAAGVPVVVPPRQPYAELLQVAQFRELKTAGWMITGEAEAMDETGGLLSAVRDVADDIDDARAVRAGLRSRRPHVWRAFANFWLGLSARKYGAVPG